MPVLSSIGARAVGYAGKIAAVRRVGLHFTGPALPFFVLSTKFCQATPAGFDDKGESVPGGGVSILTRPLAEPPFNFQAPKSQISGDLRLLLSNLLVE